jgi:tetratricopeptide (TPR) repeat protein
VEVEHKQSDSIDGKRSLAVEALERGLEYLENAEHRRAIACFTEAIRLSPRFTEAYLARACAYDEKGDLDLAIADCTEVIRLDPERAIAYHLRGEIYSKTNSWAKAERDVAKARLIEARPQ